MGSGKPPGEIVRLLIELAGWTQAEFALIIGRSKRNVSDVVLGRFGITPEMAIALGAAFGTNPRDWLMLDGQYRLSLAASDTAEIEKRAKLFTLGPLREMQRRGWIKTTDDVDELESELELFFDHKPGDPENKLLSVAAKRTITLPKLTPAESAWCFRAKRLASTLLAPPFAEGRLTKAKSELRRLASHPKEARYLSEVLSDYGIRFVVVEPLAGVRIDGATFWDEIGPVVAVSLRHDRVDGFWFTVMHEFSHVFNGDAISVDCGMVDGLTGVLVRLADNEAEDRADKEAAESLIPAKELDSFINRVGPLYTKDRVVQFANRIRIHPGIIVGQLQYRNEIGYASMRDQLVKVREVVTSTALTDGWGHTISPSVTRRPK
jgi:HTH-type transcriptional regulator/antitoxin HigA